MNKRKAVRVGAYFQHLSIDYHLANIARVCPAVAAGRALARSSEGVLSAANFGVTALLYKHINALIIFIFRYSIGAVLYMERKAGEG